MLINAVTGKILLTMSRHASRVLHLDWSPDGKRLLSGTEEQTCLWGGLNIQWPIRQERRRSSSLLNRPASNVFQANIGSGDVNSAKWLYDQFSQNRKEPIANATEEVLAFSGTGKVNVRTSDFGPRKIPGTITVECWVEPQASQVGHLFRYEIGKAVVLAIHNNRYEFGVITSDFDGRSGWTQTWACQTSFESFGDLTHVALTWDGKNSILFVNGTRQKPADVSRHWGSMNRVRLDSNNNPRLTWDRYGWRLSNTIQIAPLFRGYLHSMRLSSGVRYEKKLQTVAGTT